MNKNKEKVLWRNWFARPRGENKGLQYPRGYLEPDVCVLLRREFHSAYHAWQTQKQLPITLETFAAWLRQKPTPRCPNEKRRRIPQTWQDAWKRCTLVYPEFPRKLPDSWEPLIAELESAQGRSSKPTSVFSNLPLAVE